jgi:hypothetical protein
MADETTQPRPPGEDPAGKWEELIDEWVDCTKATLDRAAVRARDNVKLARQGKYGLGAWLDDVQWFWSSVADDASHVVGTARGTTAGRAPTEPGGRR